MRTTLKGNIYQQNALTLDFCDVVNYCACRLNFIEMEFLQVRPISLKYVLYTFVCQIVATQIKTLQILKILIA